MAGEEGGSVAASFDKYLGLYREIEASPLPTADPHLQSQIQSALAGLVRTTVLASEGGIFSTNETLDDLPTSSIKLLLLPALLGSLTLRRTDTQRPEVLRLASVYFKDFLRRCCDYHVVEGVGGVLEEEEEEEEDGEDLEREERRRVATKGDKPTPQELQAMARQRQDKIQRYREKKELEARLAELQKVLDKKKGLDEEVLREYQLKLVRKFVFESVEELESVTMERQMLRKISLLKLKDSTSTTTTTTTTSTSSAPPPPAVPLRPILITRDAYQRNVFGLGYPSHPTMTVEEFYDQRVKDGWFPDPTKSHGCLQDRATLTKEEEDRRKEEEEEEEERKEEEEDPNHLDRLRERDEWRDTHRRGWGNTYNRS